MLENMTEFRKLDPWEEFLEMNLTNDDLVYLRDGWAAITHELYTNGIDSAKNKYGCYIPMVISILKNRSNSIQHIELYNTDGFQYNVETEDRIDMPINDMIAKQQQIANDIVKRG